MAHMIDMTNKRANMAYVGDVPWHGLGQQLTAGSSIETWTKEAGFDWEVKRAPIHFPAEGFGNVKFEDRYSLYRSDTGAGLGICADIFKPVQPREVLEFYRDLVGSAGFELETAGMLKGGAQYWALARTGKELTIGKNDRVKGYVLLATGNDGMATTAMFTSVRVVCNNTLSFAIDGEDGKHAIKIPHVSNFIPEDIKNKLGLFGNSWENFGKEANEMSKRKVSREEALKFFLDTAYPKKKDFDADKVPPTIMNLVEVMNTGVGQSTASAKGTVWGLVNAITRYIDHEKKSFDKDAKLRSAWLGDGERMKVRAYENALKLVA